MYGGRPVEVVDDRLYFSQHGYRSRKPVSNANRRMPPVFTSDISDMSDICLQERDTIVHHGTITRIAAIVMLMLGLSPAFAATYAVDAADTAAAAAPAASSQTGDTGLTSDTTYESPQFGYAVAWSEPWQTRARNVTSNPGGFDSLTLRDGSSNLRITGHSGEDDPATVLADSIALETDNATDSEIISQSTGSVPLTAELRVRANTVLIEVQGLPENDALVVITLSARSADFDAVLASTQQLVTINDAPILNGEGSGTATPAATGDGTPTAETSASATETPKATETATGESTPSDTGVSGVDGTTYTSPQHGYSFSWNGSVWNVPAGGELSKSDQAFDSLELDAPTGLTYIYAFDGYAGNAATCLQGESDFYATQDPSVTGWTPAKDANGDPLTEVTGTTSAWGVFNLDFQNSDPTSATRVATPAGTGASNASNAVPLTDYIECRTLVPGKSILIIFASASRASYNDHIDRVQTVLDTISIPGGDATQIAGNGTPIPGDVTPEATATPTTSTDATPNAGDVTPDATATATRTTQTPSTPATGSGVDIGAVDGLKGSVFTSPSFDFVFDIPSDWTIQDATVKPNDETITLNNGTSTVTVFATNAAAYTTDLPSCVKASAADLQADPAYAGLKLDRTSDGSVFQGSDDQSAYANYTYTSGGTKYAHFIECRFIAEGESVVIVSQDVPYDQYTTERSARIEIRNSITLP